MQIMHLLAFFSVVCSSLAHNHDGNNVYKGIYGSVSPLKSGSPCDFEFDSLGPNAITQKDVCPRLSPSSNYSRSFFLPLTKVIRPDWVFCIGSENDSNKNIYSPIYKNIYCINKPGSRYHLLQLQLGWLGVWRGWGWGGLGMGSWSNPDKVCSQIDSVIIYLPIQGKYLKYDYLFICSYAE